MTRQSLGPIDTYSLSDLARSLATTSNIAKKLGIDISQQGVWRRVVIANALGHNLIRDRDDPLLDATKDEVKYCYLGAHYGKRAQLYLVPNTLSKPRKDHTFIIAFFSDTDSSKILSIWSCKSEVLWEEVDDQRAKKAKKSKSKSKSDKPQPHLAWFSEAWLRSKKDKGSELLFKDEYI